MFEIKTKGKSETIYITKGDYGKFQARMRIAIDPSHPDVKTPYVMQPGDRLIFTVRKEPKADSPVLMHVESETDFIVILPEKTRDLDVGTYSGDCELITADGKVFTFWPNLESINTSSEKNYKNFVICPEVSVP